MGASITQTNPRDLAEGQRIRFSSTTNPDLEGTVVKSDRKGARLRVLLDGSEKPITYKYTDLLEVGLVDDAGTDAAIDRMIDDAPEGALVAVWTEDEDEPTFGGLLHEKNDEEIVVEDAQRRQIVRTPRAEVLRLEVEDANPSGGDPALRKELDALMEERRGWTRQQADRVKEIRTALGLDTAPTGKANGGKGKKKPTAGTRVGGNARPKYPVEISEAVALAKKARGTTHGAPGAKQHLALRCAVANAVDKTPTKAIVLDFLGMTEKALKDAASGKMPTEKLRQCEGLHRVAKLDDLQDPKIRPWIGGRNGASILVAWLQQIS